MLDQRLKKLSVGENHLRAICDALSEAVFLLGIESGERLRCLWVNRTASDLLGLRESDVIGCLLHEFLGTEATAKAAEVIHNAIRSKTSKSLRGAVDTSRGRLRLEAKFTPIFEQNGQCVQVIAIANHSADRVNLTARQKTLFQRERALLDSIHDFAWMKDREGRFLAVNQPLAKAVGTTPEEMVGKRGADYWSLEYEKTFLENDAVVMKTGEAMRCTELFYDEHGRRISRDSIKVPIRDEEGRIIGTAGTSRDTSALQDAFEALQKHKELLAEAESIGRVAHIEWNFKTGKIEQSAAFLDVLGITDDQRVDTVVDFLGFVHPEDRTWFEKAYEIFKEEGGRLTVEYRIQTKSGKVLHIQHDAQAYCDSDGCPERMVGMLRDITESKEFEERLRNSREDLKRLSMQLLRLQEDERRKIAHELHDEFGQTLAALKMDLHWIKGRLHESQKELQERAERMSEWIGSAMRSIRRTVTELRPTLLDELGLVEAIRWQLKEFAARSRVQVGLRIDPEGLTVDPSVHAPLFRIVQEALTNVSKHAEARRVDVELSSCEGGLRLKISDDGLGFGPAARAKLTLGLIGMRERAELIGGAFEIRSAPGKGTVITVRL